VKITKSQITFVIEYDSTDNRNQPLIRQALEYLIAVGDGIRPNEYHEIPGSGSEYDGRGPTRVLWHAEHGMIDWTRSTTTGFDEVKIKPYPLKESP